MVRTVREAHSESCLSPGLGLGAAAAGNWTPHPSLVQAAFSNSVSEPSGLPWRQKSANQVTMALSLLLGGLPAGSGSPADLQMRGKKPLTSEKGVSPNLKPDSLAGHGFL